MQTAFEFTKLYRITVQAFKSPSDTSTKVVANSGQREGGGKGVGVSLFMWGGYASYYGAKTKQKWKWLIGIAEERYQRKSEIVLTHCPLTRGNRAALPGEPTSC